MKKALGFTLIELMVVVAIIGILTAIVYTNFSDSRAQARDTERQADLQNVKSALELYKNKYGRYPAGCNGAGTWSGQVDSGNKCSNDSVNYIEGLAPEFIPKLPIDPRLNSTVNDSGYAYITNADGTVYKFVAYQTVEEFKTAVKKNVWVIVPEMKPFYFCDKDGSDGSLMCAGAESGNTISNDCNFNRPAFHNSYAVWGGYADADLSDVERETEPIVCAVP